MKLRKLMLAGSLVGAACLQFAWADIQALHRGNPHDALFAVTTSKAGLVAVGSAGHYSTSSDGRSWQREQITAPTQTLLSISVSEETTLAVGQEGVILRREADKWEKVATPTNERLMAVAQGREGLALAVGGFGTVLRSTDSGRNWQVLKLDWQALIQQTYEPHVYNVLFDADNNVFIVGEFGMIAQSTDQGVNWSAAHVGDESIFGIAINASGQGFAVGQSGLILRTEDGGKEWQPLPSGTGAILLDVAVRADGAAFISGIREALKVEANADAAQSLSTPPFLESWFSDVTVFNDEFYVVGQQAQVVKVNF